MKNKYSLYSLLFCYVFIMVSAIFISPKWEKQRTEATLSWDVSGYYMYLPAIFIYKDIKQCRFLDSILVTYYPTPNKQQVFLHPASGNYVMKYASGQALMMLPFFTMAHCYAKLSGTYPADGFSYPYQKAIGLGMLFFSLLGLWMLRKILLPFFRDTSVALLLLIYVLGTNYINYAAIDQAMTHNVLFAIYTLIIYFTLRFHHKPSLAYATWLGLCLGLAILIRPTEIVAVLIPLLWDMKSLTDIKHRWSFIYQHYHYILWTGILTALVFSIQLFYWKYTTQEWLVYSYQDQGFSWFSPHVKNYLFSYECGWLRYTPMMLLPLCGLPLFARYGKQAIAHVATILISAYVVMAWDVWDYGGTAGRAMIQYYPLLAFPFCRLLDTMQRSLWLKISIGSLLVFFTYLHLWWFYHAHTGHIQVSGINKAYYWKVIGRWRGNDVDKKLLDNPHHYEGIPKQAVLLYANDFSHDSSANATLEKGSRKIRLHRDLQHTSRYSIARNDAFKKWIRVQADFYAEHKEWDVWKQAQFIVQFTQQSQSVQTNMIRIYRFLNDFERKPLYLDALCPTSRWDSVHIVFWNALGDRELFIDNLELISFDE